MAKFNHRIAFNCDLFMTIQTDSPDTTLEELEKLAIAAIRDQSEDCVLSDAAFEVPFLPEAVIYPRHAHGDCPDNDAEVELENLTIENVEEVSK